tara:strand:+ start:229 stop:795 length:567 start_codon:yes stop_codon:yes gene_type:complete
MIGSIFSQETTFGEVEAKKYNDLLGRFIDTSFSFSYMPDTERLGMYQKSALATSIHVMTLDNRDTLIKIVDKYLEWRETAIENEVKIQKKIEIDFNSIAAFMYGGELYLSENGKMYGTLFSRSEKKHELVLTFEELVSTSNEYITHKPDILYIKYEDVLNLKKLISDENIEKVIEEINKQKDVDNLFN